MREYTIRPLTSETWPAFEALCARNNGGGMGGCWCLQFHYATSPERRAAIDAVQSPGTDREDARREHKRQLVGTDRAHAALVFDGELAVGWCQYGSPAELPGITHRKEVEVPGRPVPDFRLGCFLVDRRHRRRGIAEAALAGALELIAQSGGGVVEAYPFDTSGRKVSGSFLYNGTREMCERAGFTYERPKGKNHCIMTKRVDRA